MAVSKVREGLAGEHLGPFWTAPGRADSPERAEAVAWARRQLSWERRLAALQDSAAENEGPLDAEQDVVQHSQTAQGA